MLAHAAPTAERLPALAPTVFLPPAARAALPEIARASLVAAAVGGWAVAVAAAGSLLMTGRADAVADRPMVGPARGAQLLP
ncbi:hypothetical protein [Roseisolibacter sp. H3M3-2]|uniref:hypothetical protein n=1 Tax=Roseisolibacter sp. H3M3-2 TaxID=3031323 RepID=UPI0023DC400B|nr:hypothetical protein [Roseisolibacter sp. H3M3-2]MDF1503693.1 hypothetical protein [Roseisolibacter sp. H3M3-2]